MCPASTHRHRHREPSSRVALLRAACGGRAFSCAFCFSAHGLGSLPARALMGAVAACASMLLRARLDHSHSPGDHRSLGGHGDMAMSSICPMDEAWLLIASVARLPTRDHSALHARRHTPPSAAYCFPRSQHRRRWRRRQVDGRPRTQFPERDGLGLGNWPPSSFKLFQSSRQLPTPPGASPIHSPRCAGSQPREIRHPVAFGQ